MQVDDYAGYRALAQRNSVSLAFCWAHVRRRFFELAAAGPAPIASEALERIGALYAVESDIRGRSPDQRREARQEKSRPILDALEPWLREKLALISQKTKLAEAIRYALSRWYGLMRFVDDGRIEIDSNIVERAIRPIALNRKNALFAGSDGGAEKLGDRCVAHRDLQAQWRRSVRLHDRRAHQDRRRPSREQARRTHAMGLRVASRAQRRGLITAGTPV